MAHSRLAGIWKAGCKTKHTEHKNLPAIERLRAIFAARYLQAGGAKYRQ